MDPVVAAYLQWGVLGLTVAGLLMGWIVPKWVLDYFRVKLDAKDEVIKDLSEALRELGDVVEHRRRG